MKLENGKLKLYGQYEKDGWNEKIYLKQEKGEQLVLESFPHATLLEDERSFAVYYQEPTKKTKEMCEDGIASVILEHPDYTLKREISFEKILQEDGGVRKDTCEDTLHFRVTLTAKKRLDFRAVEDKWNYMIAKRETDTPMEGPLDFVWSQRIKTLPSDIVSHYNFRTPIVMLQQNEFFVGLIAGLEGVTKEDLEKVPLGMDMNVTEDEHPWISYGGIGIKGVMPDTPCDAGHTHIVRGRNADFIQIHLCPGESCVYSYSIIACEAEKKMGYRKAQRYIWDRYSRYRKETCQDIYENVRFPGIMTLQDWEKEVWEKRTEEDFYTYKKNGKTVGAVTGKRQGEWFSRTDYKHDAWFACWLQELATGYGMFHFGEKSSQEKWKVRAEQILELILQAPQTKGMFPVVCYLEEDGTETWLRDDGWAGYYKEFHTLQMSYTAWLLVLWAERLFPERKEEILNFCTAYAEFLLSVQHEDGCIPSWFNENGEPSRVQFRDFNAETAASAIFLLELGDATRRQDMIEAGMRGVDFVDGQVRPRQRWFDLETFLSCAKKSFAFYDGITAQYPQCNLSTIFAGFAYLKRYRITGNETDKKKMEEVIDYLLLTQQVWNHPGIQIDVFGGFTVQNTDNEWNDAREALCAVLLYEAWRSTGAWEYLERAVAAMHAGFQNLPYENWAHCGYEGMQYDSSLLWGCGIILAAAEYFDEYAELILYDANAKKAIGLWGIQIEDVSVAEGMVDIRAVIPERLDKDVIRVGVYGAESHGITVRINGTPNTVRSLPEN